MLKIDVDVNKIDVWYIANLMFNEIPCELNKKYYKKKSNYLLSYNCAPNENP